jgi:hypothetical protein
MAVATESSTMFGLQSATDPAAIAAATALVMNVTTAAIICSMGMTSTIVCTIVTTMLSLTTVPPHCPVCPTTMMECIPPEAVGWGGRVVIIIRVI